MPLPYPLFTKLEPLQWLRRVPASAWVPLALVIGSAPWIAAAVELFWPDLLP